jgi:hypothetical protein
MRYVVHIWERGEIYKISIRKFEGKRLLRKPGYRWRLLKT